MKREIKFRAWDKSEKRFWTQKEMNKIGGFYYNYGVSPDSDNFELQQFTGLHDKNGVEIYEGDILSSEYPREDCGNCHPVVWGHGRWNVNHSIHDCCRAWRGDLNGHHMSEQIIGNIYENPELL